MDVAEAVKRAKSYVSAVFADEGVSQLRLEEVEFDDIEDVWLVTVSALQPVLSSNGLAEKMSPSDRHLARTYKLVRLADDGTGIPSVKVRSFALEEQ